MLSEDSLVPKALLLMEGKKTADTGIIVVIMTTTIASRIPNVVVFIGLMSTIFFINMSIKQKKGVVWLFL